jgi:hypothetical protein
MDSIICAREKEEKIFYLFLKKDKCRCDSQITHLAIEGVADQLPHVLLRLGCGGGSHLGALGDEGLDVPLLMEGDATVDLGHLQPVLDVEREIHPVHQIPRPGEREREEREREREI